MRCHDWRIETDGRVCLLLGEDGSQFKVKATIDFSPYEVEQFAKELLVAAQEVECLERIELVDADKPRARSAIASR